MPPSAADQTLTNGPGKFTKRARNKKLDNLHNRGRNNTRHELGGNEMGGERATVVYPRQLTKSPTARHQRPTSPTTDYPTTTALLSALGTTANTAQYTNEWTKSLPFFANQQATRDASISGSPPAFGSPPSIAPHASNSPPVNGNGRPLSYPNHLYETRNNSPMRNRRASHVSQRRPGHAPLPHEWQPHFNGIPQLDLNTIGNINSGPTIPPGTSGYGCALDTLIKAGGVGSSAADNVLIVGQEGGVEVHKIGRSTCNTKFGAISGLRGSVIGAKILPWTGRDDLYHSMRPLVALVIHGPILREAGNNISGSSSAVGTDEHGSSSESPSRPEKPYAEPTHYRTTVELYSLREHRHIATIYSSVPVPVLDPISSRAFEPPPPVGDLRIDANGKFIVVASGLSGEVFIYALSRYGKAGEEHVQPFRCIGKVWTQLVHRDIGSVSGASSGADVNSQSGEGPEQVGVPLFSLSHRWLVIVPPTAQSPYSIEGTVLTAPSHTKPPGLSNNRAPPQPNITCSLDVPDGNGFKEKAMREAWQTTLRVAGRASEAGKEAWNNYWNKGTQIQMGVTPPKAEPEAYFPPTHGYNFTQPFKSNEPTPISVLDLQKLLDAEHTKSKYALSPVGTFPAPEGCSFVSFAPSGLMLLTVNKKGDQQIVWDLKRLAHADVNSTSPNDLTSPHVRQVFRVARWTVTTVVDVIWQDPRGERFAVLTDRGTVHLHELPPGAFTWPAPRRPRRPSQGRSVSIPNGGEENQKKGWAIGSMAAAAASGVSRLSSFRTRSVSGSAGLPALSALALSPARQGGKALKTGLSKSLGAAGDGYSKYRHASENKLHLSPGTLPQPGLIRWMTGKDVNTVALMDGDNLRLYRVGHAPAASVKEQNSGHVRVVVTKGNAIEYDIPFIPDISVPPAVHALLNPTPGDEATEQPVRGFWPPPRVQPSSAPSNWEAEVEYQTFAQQAFLHQDRRVILSGYANEAAIQLAEATNETEELFGFGTPIETVQYDVSRYSEYIDELQEFDKEAATESFQGDASEIVEKVVISTRRRRKARTADGDEEGFFEDDCDVVDYA